MLTFMRIEALSGTLYLNLVLILNFANVYNHDMHSNEFNKLKSLKLRNLRWYYKKDSKILSPNRRERLKNVSLYHVFALSAVIQQILISAQHAKRQ